MDLTLLTCNYNTPEVTRNMLKSFRLVHPHTPAVVIDTSNHVGRFSLEGAEVHPLPDSSHGNGVNFGMQKVSTDYMLLVDSDVIFKRGVDNLLGEVKESMSVLCGEVCGDRGGYKLYPRVHPWFCLIHLKELKEQGILFFDGEKTLRSRTDIKRKRWHDIGSTMYEEVVARGLPVMDIDSSFYVDHYEGMSWHVQRYKPNAKESDTDFGGFHDNIGCFRRGLETRRRYFADVAALGLPE